MRKKTEGQGLMVTLFVGQYGIGIPLSAEQLVTVNSYREGLGRSILTESAGMMYFEFGSRREGWWNSDKFCLQVTDALDCLEIVHPNCQFCIEVDQSSGHTKHREDGLSATSMGMKWGGKQSVMRTSQIPDNTCLGTEEGRTLEVGDVQNMIFQEVNSFDKLSN